jgi:hypothetical protein
MNSYVCMGSLTRTRSSEIVYARIVHTPTGDRQDLSPQWIHGYYVSLMRFLRLYVVYRSGYI